jgi:peptidoglycan/LPS O-acetylase OafA/YrhL
LEDRTLTTRGFMKIRLIRLYPVYFLATCVSVAATWYRLHHEGSSPDAALAEAGVLTLLFVPNHYGVSDYLFPLNGVFWSLFFELLMNLVLAVVVRRGAHRLMVAMVIAFAIATVAGSVLNNGLDNGFTWAGDSLASGVSRSGFGIFAGYVLRRIRRPPRRAVSTSVGVALVIASVFAILHSPTLGPYDWLFDSVVVLLAFPAVVYAGSRIAVPRAMAAPFKWFGEASYPLYALHMPAGVIASLAMARVLPHGSVGVGMVSLVCASLAMLAVSRLYDIPIRRVLSRRLGGGHGPDPRREPG